MDSQMLLYTMLFDYSYMTHVVYYVYKSYNVRILRKVHDVGSFLGATDGQAAVESCNICLTIICRPLQVSKESEQIRMR